MFKVLLFILICFINYTHAMCDLFVKTNLSQVKVLILQEDTVNIYKKDFINNNIHNIEMYKVNNLYFNSIQVQNTSNLKIVCKKHVYDVMICDKDLLLFTLNCNQQKCNLVFSSMDHNVQIVIQEIINIIKNFILYETMISCIKFFGLYLIIKLIIKILNFDTIDFTTNIYTR